MNSVRHQILEVLQSSFDGHATARNVFNVLNRDGYEVTKQEFEAACEKLHEGTCITYQPIRSSLIDIPIGSLDLLTKSPVLSPFSEDEDLVPNVPALGEDAAMGCPVIQEVRSPLDCETESDRADPIRKPSVDPPPTRTSVFAGPILLMRVWQRARASFWFAGFPAFSFRF